MELDWKVMQITVVPKFTSVPILLQSLWQFEKHQNTEYPPRNSSMQSGSEQQHKQHNDKLTMIHFVSRPLEMHKRCTSMSLMIKCKSCGQAQAPLLRQYSLFCGQNYTLYLPRWLYPVPPSNFSCDWPLLCQGSSHQKPKRIECECWVSCSKKSGLS